jgi:3-oxoadipate enol-lactonase
MPLQVHRGGIEDREADTVVFIHGFPFDGTMWEPQLAALPSGWRGLAPDLPGFGRSDLGRHRDLGPSPARSATGIARPDEPVLTMDGLADDVAALIREESGAPVVVCGLSMGGYVAFALWRRHRDLVRALILADTRAEADSDEARENRLRMAQAARETGARPVASAMLPTLVARRTLSERPEVAERVRGMIMATPAETLVAALAGMAARPESSRDLPSVDVPALVVVGEEDALSPPAVGRAMARQLPDARLAVLPGAGHLSNLEDPAAFNAVLTELLTSL